MQYVFILYMILLLDLCYVYLCITHECVSHASAFHLPFWVQNQHESSVGLPSELGVLI